ncbi:LOW QUALITY PROTEIN: SAG family member [Eimeria necatrix]|uniref:SAG family member n=1 Tax=Eimeria necatrix TaxID=51315 RepID=U6MZJ6_9EIME|nr:LOW QUALITY PROTEIN: SAG family member [Eimeria necatrix]CDJ69633.1 SAG family member [Eimeria necatrix]
MARLSFVSLLSLSLLFGQQAARAQDTYPTANAGLEAMNELRKAAGLPEFGNAVGDAVVLPAYSHEARTAPVAETLWKTEICPKVLGGARAKSVTEAVKLTGNFAYYPVTDGKKECSDALEYWKGGLSQFNDKIPPTFQALNNPAVYNDRAVSFVALYNPKPSPVVSCVLLQCPNAGGVGGRRLAAGTTDAVICLTNPAPLAAGSPPFETSNGRKLLTLYLKRRVEFLQSALQ